MQKWYVEDYLTHRCVKNSGEKPQYFVEEDHDPIVPKAVFYLDRVVVKDDGYEVVFKAGVTVEVEI